MHECIVVDVKKFVDLCIWRVQLWGLVLIINTRAECLKVEHRLPMMGVTWEGYILE
jgi:hypothetical protein